MLNQPYYKNITTLTLENKPSRDRLFAWKTPLFITQMSRQVDVVQIRPEAKDETTNWGWKEEADTLFLASSLLLVLHPQKT